MYLISQCVKVMLILIDFSVDRVIIIMIMYFLVAKAKHLPLFIRQNIKANKFSKMKGNDRK